MKKLLNKILERTPRLSWAWRQLFAVILPLALAFALAMGCYKLFGLLFEGFAAEPSQAVLYEVLTIVLAIAAIGIAAIGIGAYRLLAASIEAAIKSRSDREFWLTRVKQTVDTGWLYWHLYQLAEEKPLPSRKFFLQQAINETRWALEWIHSHLDSNDRDVEMMLVIARNNWAYYIYEFDRAIEQVSQADKTIAMECVAYLRQRISRFPSLAEDIHSTIQKVAGHFSSATS